MGTVRGTFDLNSKPASSALRDLRAEGDKTELTFKNVGKALDGVGTTKQREQVRLYTEAVKRMGKAWETTATKQDAAWDNMERKTLDSVTTQSAAIDSLQGRVDELGRSRPTIDVNTRGVDEALAKIELLHKRVNALGRERATPSVGIGGARPPGVGGGGGGRSHGLNIPFAGSIPYPIVAGALGAAPPLLGSATGVLGSATAGALGAGAIGTAGFGTLAVGVGSIAAVAVPAVKGLKETYKAMQHYNLAVKENGKNSTQAHTALSKLNAVLQSSPSGTRNVINQEQRLTSRFQAATKPAQGSFLGSIGNILGAGNRLVPQISGIANPLLASGERQSQRFGNFLTGKTSRAFIGAAGNTAIEELPEAESILQNVLGTLMNISRASMPYFKEAVRFLDSWTKGWRDSTGNIDSTRRTIGGMVGQLKLWVRLGGAAFDLVKDLFKSSTKSGGGLVGSLTKQLEKWDEWINKNPAKVRSFFQEAAEQTEKIAGALGSIAGVLWRVGRLLSPLLSQLSQFVSFLDSAGLLSNGSLPLLLAGGAGIRNAIGGARGRILGRGATATGGAGATEGLLLAGALGGGGTAAARGSVFSRGRGFLGGIRNAYRSAGRVPIVGAGGTLAAEADAGLIGETAFSRTAGFLGAGRVAAGGILPEATRLGGGFIRGAGARFLPIAALMGGLSAASYPGGIRGRAQAFLSGVSGGLYPAPKTAAENEDEGTRHAQMVANYYAEKYGGGRRGVAEQIQAIRRKRHRLLTPQEHGGFLTTNANPFSSEFGEEPKSVPDDVRKEAEALEKQMQQLRAGRVSEAVERGGIRATQFAKSFDIRKAHVGGKQALDEVAPQILGGIKHLGPQGGKVLAAATLQWVRAAKQENPKLKGQYEELVTEITHSFARMGQHIKIINGEIYTGSAAEWNKIRQAMSGPVEQAREEMSKQFTAIQREAMDVLRAMGYSPSMAHKIIGGMESKNPQTKGAAEAAAQQKPGNYNAKILNGASGPPTPTKKGARGMRIPGMGNVDNVPIGGATGIGAPGELILNQHTEAKANRFLGHFGTSLEALQRSERLPHSSPLGQLYGRNAAEIGAAFGTRLPGFKRGGRAPSTPATAWRGIGPGGLHQGVRKLAAAVMGHYPGLQVTSTTSGGHAANSYHYLGEAVDISGGTGEMYSAANWIKQSGLARQLTEGIHNPNLSYKYGKPVPSSYWGAETWAAHGNHLHLAVAHEIGRLAGLGGGGGRAGGRGLGGGRSISLKRPKARQGGIAGALEQAAGSAMATGLEQKINKRLGGGRGGYRGKLPGGGSVPAQIARVLLRGGLNKVGAAGIIGNAYAESTWDPSATGYGGGGLWGFTASPNSLADLQAYAAQAGGSWTNAGLQTRFLLQHVPRSLISQLNASSSPEAAAALFMNEWERPGIPRQSVREEGARKAFSMGFARGGRVPRFAGFFRHGGSFVTRGPTSFVAGEGGGPPERVRVEPHKPKRIPASRRGGGRRPIEIKFLGDVHVRSEADIERLADAIGKKLVGAIADDDGIDDEEVIG